MRSHGDGQFLCVGKRHRLVHLAFARPELTAVTGLAMQEVVEPLGDGEELGRPLNRHPTHVEAGAAGVGGERPQHLRDPAALGRGVHVPHCATVEKRTRGFEGVTELGPVVWFQHRLESVRRERWRPHLVRLECHADRDSSTPDSTAARTQFIPKAGRREVFMPIGPKNEESPP